MLDEPNVPEGTPAPLDSDGTKTPPTKIDQSTQLLDRIAKLELENAQMKPLSEEGKKLIKQREEAKKKAGEFEGLFNDLEPKYKTLEANYTTLKAEHDAMQLATKNGLLATLKDRVTEDVYTVYEGEDVRTLQLIVKALPADKPPIHKPTGAAGAGGGIGEKPHTEYTEAEIGKFIADHGGGKIGGAAWTAKILAENAAK